MSVYLPTAIFDERGLVFHERDGFDRACLHGAFHLRYPDGLAFQPAIELSQKYYLDQQGGADDLYRGFRTRVLEKSLMGYSQTGSDQDELLQIEAPLWREYLPAPAADLLWSLNELNRQVLVDLFVRSGVDPADIDTIAGGLSSNQALQYCIFNHYRSEVEQPVGLTAHKDSGFITILYTTEAGLESQENGVWVPFDPLARHFTVVLGHSFEVLTTNLSRPVKASYHRVRGMARRRVSEPERFTFGVYIGPRWDQDLYQYGADGRLQAVQSFLDFQKAKAAEMAYEFHPRVEVAVG
jgi:hypothetical protein